MSTTNPYPWMLLVLDREYDDPRWLIAAIRPADVHPAVIADDGSVDRAEGFEWARRQIGRAVAFEKLPERFMAWHVVGVGGIEQMMSVAYQQGRKDERGEDGR